MENRDYLLRVYDELKDVYTKGSMFDYLNDVLEYEYIINADKTYKGVKCFLTLGGPNIWIDTTTNSLNLAWWGERDSILIDTEISNEIDFIFEELYINC